MTFSHLRFGLRERIGTITIDRPEKRNALDRATWIELESLLRRIADMDPEELRVVIIHGAGESFSVGGDIDGFGELVDGPSRRDFLEQVFAAYSLLEDLPMPTIAAVHGLALGGGCELTIVCDLVIADESARFGTPEGRVGLLPGIAAARGHSQLNAHWMKFLAFTGEQLDAHQARDAGLVNLVVPLGEHVSEAERLAAQIASRAPLALREAKRIVNGWPAAGYDTTLEVVPELMGTQDHREGIAAFRERREPSFSGE